MANWALESTAPSAENPINGYFSTLWAPDFVRLSSVVRGMVGRKMPPEASAAGIDSGSKGFRNLSAAEPRSMGIWTSHGNIESSRKDRVAVMLVSARTNHTLWSDASFSKGWGHAGQGARAACNRSAFAASAA